MSKKMLCGSIFLLLGIVSCHSASQAARTAQEITAALRECVDSQNRAPGIVVGVIDERGTRVIAYGQRERGKAEKVDGDTLFEIGSITKVFTTALLQEMVDRGEVKLDDPIGRFLPASVKTPAHGGKEITLLDLATHTSGLPSTPDNLSPKDGDDPWADYTVDQMYAFLSNYKLSRTPGAKFEYSNFGMGLLGHVLALRAGTNYESLLVNRICAPLQMNSTRITLSPNLESRLARGHGAVGPPVKNWGSLALQGDGALYSSVNDMLKFLAANMGRVESGLSATMTKTHAPQRRAALFQKTGLAWLIYSGFGAHYTWHNGGTGGYRSFIGFDREQRRGAVVLANSANDIDDIGRFLLLPGVFDSVDKFKAPRQRAVAGIDRRVYEKYIGRYQFGPGRLMTIARDGDRLIAQESGKLEFPYEVFPESETEFFFTAGDAQLKFVRGNSGAVTGLILHQDGTDQTATKIQ